MRKYIALSIISLFLISCTQDKQQMLQFHQQVCALPDATKSASPWHIRHLYDCDQGNLFLPYQLWSGAPWNGDKDANCMHEADITNYRNRRFQGPIEWKNISTGKIETTWRESRDSGVVRLFKCHSKGIGRHYDNRKPNYVYWDYRCAFPAGYGWELGKKRHCLKTTIEITHIRLDADDNLDSITYDWWINDKYNHQFTYQANASRVPTPEDIRRPGTK
ncbi:MAG: hypothetical protein ACI9NY_000853 [Kiritimatiellia bacterium]|jgi:hypothetical protein